MSTVDVSLRPITEDNASAVRALRCTTEQERFVSSVSESLAEAEEYPEAKPWFRAVYADEEPIGFVMLSWNCVPRPPDIIGPWFLWKLLIDHRHQSRGYGHEVVRQVSDLVRREGADELLTSYVPGEGGPAGFYAGLGFVPTGEVDQAGEIIVRRVLRRGPRSFDPDAVGDAETLAWSSYYRREWRPFLEGAVGMVREGFGMGRLRTLRGAYYVLRANQKWAPYPDNDPDAAREYMRRFYALVLRGSDLPIDPVEASRREVEWWRLHREHQYGVIGDEEPLVDALVALYAYVYDVPGDTVREAARQRVRAMEHSDAWVEAGCHLDDPLLALERQALRASYRALRAAVG